MSISIDNLAPALTGAKTSWEIIGMQAYTFAAGVLALIVGAAHSVLGEILIFRHLRSRGLVPASSSRIRLSGPRCRCVELRRGDDHPNGALAKAVGSLTSSGLRAWNGSAWRTATRLP